MPYGETVDDDAERFQYHKPLTGVIVQHIKIAIDETYPDEETMPDHLKKVPEATSDAQTLDCQAQSFLELGIIQVAAKLLAWLGATLPGHSSDSKGSMSSAARFAMFYCTKCPDLCPGQGDSA